MVAPTAHGAAPLGLVKRTEAEFDEWVATEPGFATSLMNYDDDPLTLQAYQMSFMSSRANYRCAEKGRQTGFSFLMSIEALARAHLRPTQTSIFVSYNLEDAKEKISYCRQLHEELPLEFQKKLVNDSKLALSFRSNDSNHRLSRIISNPSKAPRGKHGDIYLDELAHCPNDREIYKGSTALILRSGGQLTVCSTPLGRRGVFWELAREELKSFRYYSRQSVPWWLCSDFCTDVEKASRIAHLMSTEDRVARFGKPGIVEQFDSLLLDDFKQEFEVYYSDEGLTFFPYDLILGNCVMDPEELASDFTGLASAKGRLVGGFDVGRKRDLSELAVFEELSDGRLKARLLRSYDKVKFKEQEADLRALLTIAPLARLSIDQNGIGMQLAENMASEFPGIVVEEQFSERRKEMWSTDFKIGLQRRMIDLPRDRVLVGQIHSVRRRVTENGRILFGSEASGDKDLGHADKYWACALACQKERSQQITETEVAVRILG